MENQMEAILAKYGKREALKNLTFIMAHSAVNANHMDIQNPEFPDSMEMLKDIADMIIEKVVPDISI